MKSSKCRKLVILGIMGKYPFGGQSWLYLNWILGFSRLGHEVYYIEDDTAWPYDPTRNTVSEDSEYAVKHIAHCMQQIGLPNNWAFRRPDQKGACWGMSSEKLDELYTSCDALLNIVGGVDLDEKHLKAPLRIYVQTDPVTAELRLAEGDQHTREAFENHQLIFTYGENYGAPDCGVPLNGLTYKKTRQPIDLSLWPKAFDANAKYFTTIGNYRQSGSDVKYKGQNYHWSKHHEWEKFIDLPRRTSQPFELAMKCDDKDRQFLESFGWKIVEPLKMSTDIFNAYPEYFRRSRGQFTVAKDQNIRLRSGWFSERDVCYLASGKPVISQDTAFGNILPTGEGLFAFSTMEDILAALDKINSDYERHCKAARDIAEEYFDCEKVAKRLLVESGLA